VSWCLLMSRVKGRRLAGLGSRPKSSFFHLKPHKNRDYFVDSEPDAF
jgi:hypothetical protein